LKQAAVQSFAHGADMMLHFQYRSFPFGAEQLNYAIVDMDGVPRRRYYEMQETAKELKQLAALSKAEFRNEAAICLDYDSHWALRIKPINDPNFKYLDECERIYKSLADIGVNSDVISFDDDFFKYKMIVLPYAFLLSQEHREKFIEYVKNGGTLLATFLTSVKNKDNIGYTDTLPAGMTELFGATVEEVEPVFSENHTMLELNLKGKKVQSKDYMWSEMLNVKEDAESLGEYVEDYKAGQAMLSKNSYGKGIAYYLGTSISDEAMETLLGTVCDDSNISKNSIKPIDGVEVVRRYLDGKEVYFVFNFASKDITLNIDGEFEDYISKAVCKDSIEIKRNGYVVLVV
jgi:beta-galactosidase